MRTYEEAIAETVYYYEYLKHEMADEFDKGEFYGMCEAIAFIFNKNTKTVREDVKAASKSAK